MGFVGGRRMRMIWIYDNLLDDMIGRYGMRLSTVASSSALAATSSCTCLLVAS